jgi:hypothetical protein
MQRPAVEPFFLSAATKDANTKSCGVRTEFALDQKRRADQLDRV